MSDEGARAAQLLRTGEMSDARFDGLLSEHARRQSRRFWTCVEAATTASEWLAEVGVERLLDVGSGVGKFCCIASLMLGRRVWGLERRGELVFESRRLAQRLGAEVVVIEGALTQVDPRRFDAFYFFNPFGEYLLPPEERYDASPTSAEEYVSNARLVEQWLRAAPAGTTVLTFNGLGGRIPLSFSVHRTRCIDRNVLRLWRKDRPDEGLDAQVELDGEIVAASRLRRLAQHTSFSDTALVRLLCEPPVEPR